MSETPTSEHPANPLDAVMERVADGDRDAFAELYDAVAPRAYGIALRVLRNPAYAEEVTQDVMVSLWQTARRYDADLGSVDSWTITIAHRRAVDRVRHEQSARQREQADAVRTPPASLDDTLDVVVRKNDIEQVRSCLRSLTDLQRETVVLAFYEGYTYPEIAELLDVQLPTVKARMRDGLRRLRQCLRPAEVA